MKLKKYKSYISDNVSNHVKIDVITYWDESLFRDNCEETENFPCDYESLIKDGDSLFSATSDIMHEAYAQFTSRFGASEWQLLHNGDDECISFLADADKVVLEDLRPEDVTVEDYTGQTEIHIYITNGNNDVNELLFNGIDSYIEEVAKKYGIDVNALYNFTETVAMLGMDVYIQDPTDEMLKQAEEWM